MNNLLGIIKACADETRLRIIHILSAGELSVGELVDILGQSQPRVSRHLKLLAEAGVIDRFQEGTQVFCRLSRAANLRPLLSSLKDLATSEAFAADDLTALRKAYDQRSQLAQSYFEKNAASWDKLRGLYVPEEEVEAALIAQVGDQQIARHLDIGTGTARMLTLFAAQTTFGVGIDISPEMLRYAREQLAGKGYQHLQARKIDMYDIAQHIEPCDLITIHQVLHFSDQPKRLMATAKASLTQQGRILLIDFEPHNLEQLRQDHAHRKLGFSREDLDNICDASGLRIQHYQRLEAAQLTVFIADLRHL